MSLFSSTLGDLVLARISLGSVPIDGQYWYDAKRWQQSAREAANQPTSGEALRRDVKNHDRRGNAP